MSFDYTSLEYLLGNIDCFISAIREIQFFLPDGTPYKKISEGAQQEICAIKSFLFDLYKAFVARIKVESHAESWKILIKFCDNFHEKKKYSTLCDLIPKCEQISISADSRVLTKPTSSVGLSNLTIG